MKQIRTARAYEELVYQAPDGGLQYTVSKTPIVVSNELAVTLQAYADQYGVGVVVSEPGEVPPSPPSSDYVTQAELNEAIALLPSTFASQAQVTAAIAAAQLGAGGIAGTLDSTALVDRISSLTRTRAEAASSLAGQFTETWADLAAWSPAAATRTQVSAGRHYSKASGSTSGINHSFALAAGDKMRAVTDVLVKPGTAGGGVIVGVSTDAAGADMASGASSMVGLYFLQTGEVRTWNKGTNVPINTGALIAVDTTFIVTIDVDLLYISVTARPVGDSVGQEHRVKVSRASAGTINNIGVFNSDTRASAGNFLGSSVGPIKARKALTIVTPRTGFEDLTASVHLTTVTGASGATADVRVALPKTYNPQRSYPVALCFHGHGGSEVFWAPPRSSSINFNQYDTAEALLTAGYIVVSVATPANLRTWGAQSSLDCYVAAYEWLRDNYSVGPVTLWANSMGGIESLLVLAQRALPGVVAWIGHSPSVDLARVYADVTYTSFIEAAYGFSGSGGYAAATAGHDPMLMAASVFRKVPMFFVYAQDDASIPPANHAVPFIAKVTGTAAEVVVKNPTTGGHGVAIAPYLAEAIAFANKYTGN